MRVVRSLVNMAMLSVASSQALFLYFLYWLLMDRDQLVLEEIVSLLPLLPTVNMDARSLLRAKKAERGVPATSKTRKRQPDSVDERVEKKRRSEVGVAEEDREEEQEGALPSDFFDGGAAPVQEDHSDSAADDTNDQVPEAPQQSEEVQPQPQHAQRSIEDELMAFDNEISQLSTQQEEVPAYNPQVYANATISAEPVLNTGALEEGLPDQSTAPRGQKVVSEEQRRMDEEERQRRIQAYENEDYALRLEEEARAQEEADARVSALKARMEEIKARRRKA